MKSNPGLQSGAEFYINIEKSQIVTDVRKRKMYIRKTVWMKKLIQSQSNYATEIWPVAILDRYLTGLIFK